MDFLKVHFGEKGFIILIGSILSISTLTILIFKIRSRTNLIKTFVFSVLLISGVTLAWQIKLPQERIHILEYGVLGWFVSRDLFRENKKSEGIIFASGFNIFIGILDEAFQAILPYRVFDMRDIVFNSLGGTWGVCLYFLT